eukprot:TRINITY_DN1124_c1_g2_i1.p1 TRINITY_DN1124_c1_g2~~TRINITY_DN1124_c1_g2_i1.p1  ORF type:complete len:112 (+),score=38.87 TRINITY_DN1124_c1_g2_i1:82-417(+)
MFELEINNLIEWFKLNGGKGSIIENRAKIVFLSDFGFSIIATENIQSGEEIVFVPQTLLIGKKSAKENILLDDLFNSDQIFDEYPALYVIIQLLFAKRDIHSFWKPYIDIF